MGKLCSGRSLRDGALTGCHLVTVTIPGGGATPLGSHLLSPSGVVCMCVCVCGWVWLTVFLLSLHPALLRTKHVCLPPSPSSAPLPRYVIIVENSFF